MITLYLARHGQTVENLAKERGIDLGQLAAGLGIQLPK